MKLGLALSGGGIRGIAHAGVLKALEENNIKIERKVTDNSQNIGIQYTNNTDGTEEKKFEIQVVQNKEEDKIDNNYKVSYTVDGNIAEIKINQYITCVEEFENQIKLSDANNIKLNDLSQEQAKKIVEVAQNRIDDMARNTLEKVKLEDIIEAMEFANMETEYYYDTHNEKVLMLFDGMVDGEDNPELFEDIKEGFVEDYIPLPGQYDINEYRIMEEFIYELPAGKNQDVLARTIQGRGAFRRFKDKLYDLNLEKQWYQYREEAYEKIARQWSERHKIDIVE